MQTAMEVRHWQLLKPATEHSGTRKWGSSGEVDSALTPTTQTYFLGLSFTCLVSMDTCLLPGNFVEPKERNSTVCPGFSVKLDKGLCLNKREITREKRQQTQLWGKLAELLILWIGFQGSCLKTSSTLSRTRIRFTHCHFFLSCYFSCSL